MWILVPGRVPVSTMHWQRSADPSPHSRCAFTRAQGYSISRMRLSGRSVSGRSAASSARSIPYLAISSAALAVFCAESILALRPVATPRTGCSGGEPDCIGLLSAICRRRKCRFVYGSCDQDFSPLRDSEGHGRSRMHSLSCRLMPQPCLDFSQPIVRVRARASDGVQAGVRDDQRAVSRLCVLWVGVHDPLRRSSINAVVDQFWAGPQPHNPLQFGSWISVSHHLAESAAVREYPCLDLVQCQVREEALVVDCLGQR